MSKSQSVAVRLTQVAVRNFQRADTLAFGSRQWERRHQFATFAAQAGHAVMVDINESIGNRLHSTELRVNGRLVFNSAQTA